jgi:dihydrofolate reductase
MGKVIGGKTLSVDGFASDPNGDVGQLYPDLVNLAQTEVLQEEMRTTGAIVMGKRSFEMGDPDWYADNYEYQVPIFVLTHHMPAKQPRSNGRLRFIFVTDGIESAVAQAKAAAGDKNVLVIGGSINRQVINAALCDELHIGIMPVLLGGGLRLFAGVDLTRLKLEKIRVFDAGPRTDIWFRVVK